MLVNADLEHDTYLQKIIKRITLEKEMEINYWGELASVICCDRSDVYLRSLLNKVVERRRKASDEFLVEQPMKEKSSTVPISPNQNNANAAVN